MAMLKRPILFDIEKHEPSPLTVFYTKGGSAKVKVMYQSIRNFLFNNLSPTVSVDEASPLFFTKNDWKTGFRDFLKKSVSFSDVTKQPR